MASWIKNLVGWFTGANESAPGKRTKLSVATKCPVCVSGVWCSRCELELDLTRWAPKYHRPMSEQRSIFVSQPDDLPPKLRKRCTCFVRHLPRPPDGL